MAVGEFIPRVDRAQLARHWSVRCGRLVDRPAVLLERAGCGRLARVYVRCVDPLQVWLEGRQAAFVRGRL